jgi:hypothetical protein
MTLGYDYCVRRVWLLSGLWAALAGCGQSDPAIADEPDAAIPESAGFERPTEITVANERVDGVWYQLGPAN